MFRRLLVTCDGQRMLFSELNLAAEILKAEIRTQLPLPQHRKRTLAPKSYGLRSQPLSISLFCTRLP